VDSQEFLYLMRTRGWVLVPDVIEPKLLDRLGPDLEKAVERCRAVQKQNGLNVDMSGAAHHIFGTGDSLDDFVRQRYCVELIEAYLGGRAILNSYGGVINHQESSAYFKLPHRDVRTFANGYPLMLTALCMLDDFTVENGATYVLTASHKIEDQPTEKVFYEYAERLIGKRGSIALFDSAIWHAAGTNTTPRNRRCITLTFTRPFFKPQLDYTRHICAEMRENMGEGMRQLMGFNSRVPTSLEEWYQPREKRFFQADQI
jgi:hypothetical protein